MYYLFWTELVFPLCLTLGTVLVLAWYPNYILASVLVCIPLLASVPRMIILGMEAIKKSTMIASPVLSFKGHRILDAKKAVPIVVDSFTHTEYLWCAREPIDRLEHIAYIVYYPKSRVIIDAIPIETLTQDRLILAVFSHNIKTTFDLLNHGCAVTGVDNSGRTALHWAYRNHSVRIAKMLQEFGCIPQKDNLGFFPEDLSTSYASRGNQADILRPKGLS